MSIPGRQIEFFLFLILMNNTRNKTLKLRFFTSVVEMGHAKQKMRKQYALSGSVLRVLKCYSFQLK